VARGRVLALRAFDQPSRNRGRTRLRSAALERLDVSEAERLQIRQVEPADRARDVAKRVRALVAVRVRIRQLSAPTASNTITQALGTGLF